MSFVLDASVALSWLFERATESERHRSGAILDRLEAASAYVPAIWPIEVQNAILVGERRRIITLAQSAEFLDRLGALDVRIDTVPAAMRRDAVLGLARAHALSAYDASYIELAMRLGAPFGTFDSKLAKAAKTAGIKVI